MQPAWTLLSVSKINTAMPLAKGWGSDIISHIQHSHSNEEVFTGESVIVVAVELPEEVDDPGMIVLQPKEHSLQKANQEFLRVQQGRLECKWGGGGGGEDGIIIRTHVALALALALTLVLELA